MYFVYTGEADIPIYGFYIVDPYAPFSWKILSDAESVSLSTKNDHEYTASPSNAISGEGKTAAFHLNFVKGNLTFVRIVLQLENGRYLLEEKEKCWFRVPCIYPWITSDSNSLYQDRNNGLLLDEPNQTSKTLNGITLCQPKLEIEASLYNSSYVNPGLVMDSIFPESLVSGYYIFWARRTKFFSLVQYTDSTWKATFERNETLAGFCFGIGSSLLWMTRQHLDEKKRK